MNIATSTEARWRALAAGVVLFLLSAAFVVLRTGRDTLFLAEGGLFAVPRAYVAQAVLSVPQAMVVLWLMRRFGLRWMRMAAFAAAGGVGLAYTVLARPGGSWLMTLLFFTLPLVFSVAFSLAWLLGPELLGPVGRAVSSRGFSRLGAAPILGAVVGGAVARLVGPRLGAEALLAVGTLLAFAALAATAIAHERFPGSQTVRGTTEPAEPDPSTIAAVVRVPSVRLLLAVATAGAATGILVDFQFYLGAAGGADDQRVTFLANAYLCLSLGSLALQLFVTPWLTRWVGPRGALLVLPVTLAIGGSVTLASATAVARAGLRIVEGGVKQGIHRANWEQAFASLPMRLRGRVKVVVDGLGSRVGEGAAAALLLGWMHFASQGDASSLGMPWVAEVGAALVNGLLVSAAAASLVLTLLLAQRMKIDGAAESSDGMERGAPSPPVECCPMTAAAGERLLRDVARLRQQEGKLASAAE